MSRPDFITVFDFDKTLSYQDTTLPFFCFGTQGWSRGLRIIHFYMLAIAVKLGLLTVFALKDRLLQAYFKNWPKEKWEQHCLAFSRTITLNQLYKQTDWKQSGIWVISASFEDWLKPLFPAHIKVAASTILWENNQLKGIDRHLIGQAKADYLQKSGIQKIDQLFTDSKTDLPLAIMADTTVWVSGDQQQSMSRETLKQRFKV